MFKNIFSLSNKEKEDFVSIWKQSQRVHLFPSPNNKPIHDRIRADGYRQVMDIYGLIQQEKFSEAIQGMKDFVTVFERFLGDHNQLDYIIGTFKDTLEYPPKEGLEVAMQNSPDVIDDFKQFLKQSAVWFYMGIKDEMYRKSYLSNNMNKMSQTMNSPASSLLNLLQQLYTFLSPNLSNIVERAGNLLQSAIENGNENDAGFIGKLKNYIRIIRENIKNNSANSLLDEIDYLVNYL